MESFLDEYDQSSDKSQFVDGRQMQHYAIDQVCCILSLSNRLSYIFNSMRPDVNLGGTSKNNNAKSIWLCVGRNDTKG